MKIFFPVFCIIVIGFILRFWQLSSVPPSLSHDEVAIGYNAYSILKTGKDEYGTPFPMLFRSFDDYKLPGMVYATVPSVALFGLNEIGVRFPSGFFGSLSIIVFYFLVRELLGKKETISLFKKNLNVVPIFTLFFALSIWHINFSRQSFESNGAVFFLLLGTFFLLRFPKSPSALIYTAVSYAVSLYFYYSVRTIIPFLLLIALILYRKEFLKQKKYLFVSLLVGFLLLIPLLPSLLSNGGLTRISTVSVANDSSYLLKKDNFSTIIALDPTPIKKIVYNRRIALIDTVFENYLKNFSLSAIFISGTGSAGLLYLLETPFFFFGIYRLFRLQHKGKWILLVWFLCTPLAGAFSTNQPNYLRTLPNAVLFSFLSGIGFIGIINLFKKELQRSLFFLGIFVLFMISFVRFLFLYFDYYPKLEALHFGDGYKQMAQVVQKEESKYDKIYISGQYWRPYIFVLFWKKYDPALYQQKGSISGFAKYRFGNASWDKEKFSFGDPSFDFKKLQIADTRKTLFILGANEYEIHKRQFIKLSTINGRYAKNVFVVALLKYDKFNRLTQQ